MYDGMTVRQLAPGERRSGDRHSDHLPLAVRMPLVLGAASLCWLAIFALGYAVF